MEGGFAPELADTKEALRTIRDAAERAGYRMGRDIMIALDVAASELYIEEKRRIYFRGRREKRRTCRADDRRDDLLL